VFAFETAPDKKGGSFHPAGEEMEESGRRPSALGYPNLCCARNTHSSARAASLDLEADGNPGHSQAEVAVAEGWRLGVAGVHRAVVGGVGPVAAAVDTLGATRGSVGEHLLIPFPHIAMHIVQAKAVGLQLAHCVRPAATVFLEPSIRR